ncbi:MAG: MFS transporter [Acidobacteria bacterium]|nr:MAG: MFS transporter [Acidobacteriota bacterium]
MDRRRPFAISCVALVTTAMAFSIRGDVLDALGVDFHLNHEQLGVLLSPAFWGFTLSILIGGSMVDYLGMRRLLVLSSLGYMVAPLLIIFAPRPTAAVTPYYTEPGFILLYTGMLMLGLCQGLVEGVINPLTATVYSDDKTHRLNVLHAWWPGGLIIGGLLAYGITKIMGLDIPGITATRATFGWQVKMSLLLIPAAAYGLMMIGQKFPNTERVQAGVSSRDMFRELLRPMFVFWFVCMWMTASTELGPDQWVGPLVTNLTGMRGILILVYTAGIMFLLRYFASGKLAHQFSPLGLLAISAVASAAGLFALSSVRTPVEAFAAATVFGAGKTFFWPTMLGVTSERFPRGGALLLAIMGGAGNLAVAFILPLMGGWYDAHGAATAFRFVGVLPILLTGIFGVLFLYYRSTGGYRAIRLKAAAEQ